MTGFEVAVMLLCLVAFAMLAELTDLFRSPEPTETVGSSAEAMT